jgi:hypothetical protein
VDAFEGDGGKKKSGGGFVMAGMEPGKVYNPAVKGGDQSSSRAIRIFEQEIDVCVSSHISIIDLDAPHRNPRLVLRRGARELWTHFLTKLSGMVSNVL